MAFKKKNISPETQYKEKPSGISVVEKQLNVNFIYIRFWNVDVLEMEERLTAELGSGWGKHWACLQRDSKTGSHGGWRIFL